MKKGFYIRAALPFACVALLGGCTAPGGTDTQYIRLSDAACSFQGTGNRPVTIEVHTNPATWKAEASASWVKVSDVTATSFTIEVVDNDTNEIREAEITVTAGQAEEVIKVMQMVGDHSFPRYRSRPEVFQNLAPMSPNGKYVGSFYYGQDESGTTVFYPVIIDVEKDEWHELGPFPKTLFELGETSCMTDNGEVIIAALNDANILFDLDGNYTKIEPPELNYRDEPIGDVQARGISADGRIIYGTTWDNRDYGLVYWDENGEVHYVGEDVRYCRPVDRPDGYGGTYKYNLCDGMWTSATKTNVSPNGKYIAGTFRREALEEGAESFVVETNYPAFFNTETGKTVIFEELVGGGGVAATSDGLGFTVDDTFGSSSGKVVDIENGIVLGDALEWIQENYGIIVPSGYITYMPDSKDRFQGGMLWTGGAAVQGVNWYVAPPAK